MGRACGCPARVCRDCGGRGAIGAPGVSPGLDGRGAARGGIGAPGTAEGMGGAWGVPGVNPAAGAPGATRCVGGVMRGGGTDTRVCARGAAEPGEAETGEAETGAAGPPDGRAAGSTALVGASATGNGRAGTGGVACRGTEGVNPEFAPSGFAGPCLGEGGGSGRAGTEMFRFTRPGEERVCDGDKGG